MFKGLTDRFSTLFSWFTGRYAPAFVTLLVLAGIFYFYSTVIVSSNGADLKERNFRGLHRMADNIANKISNYSQKNSVNFFKSLDNHSADPEYNAFLLEEYGFEKSSMDTAEKRPPFYISYSDGWKIFFRDTSRLQASASIKTFIEPLLRRDLFEHYLLAIGDSILFDELNIAHSSFKEFLPANTAIDSVKKGPVIQTGYIRNVEVGGKEFKLFQLPFIVGDKYKFQLAGYMPAEDYRAEEKYIPMYAILWLVIGLMLVVLMFPLLKIFLIHRSEQLLTRNAVSSFASVHILASIVVLIILNIYVYFSIVRATANNKLKELAASVESTFINEIEAGLNQMDSAVLQMKKLPKPDDRLFPAKKNISGDDAEGKTYPYFQHIAWTDSAGIQQARWSNSKYGSQKIDVTDRDYFKAVKNNALWRWEDGRPFFITAVSSWVSSATLGIISRPIPKNTNDTGINGTSKLMMVSLSAPFRSMFNPVLPDGYGFCVINENGEVLFHSDPKRNLNDNMLEECTDSGTLSALINTKSSGFFGSRYSGNSHRFYVEPVSNTPYFIVTFRNMKTIWAEDLDVISACSILTLMNLGIILLAILIIQITGYKYSLLQNQSVLFSWLQPNENLKPCYQKVIIIYIWAIILQVSSYFLNQGRDQLVVAGIIFSYSFILISYAYYQFGIVGNRHDSGKKSENKKSWYILAGVYITSTALFFFNLESGRTLFLLSQVLLIAGALFVSFITELTKKQIPEGNKSPKYWYIMSVFCFILATAVAPSLLFYSMSFREESLLSIKHSQLHFTQQLMKNRLTPSPDTNTNFTLSYHTPLHYRCFADSIIKYQAMPQATEAGNDFEQLYNTIKPAFSDHARTIEYLRNQAGGIKNFQWADLPGDNIKLYYSVNRTNSYADTSRVLSILSPVESSQDRTWRSFKNDKISFLLFLITFILFLLGLHTLLRRVIKKLFFDGYNGPGFFGTLDEKFMDSIPAKEHIYINGLINSGKSRTIRNNFDENVVDIHDLDIALFSNKSPDDLMNPFTQDRGIVNKDLPPKKQIALVKHFEMFVDNPAVTAKKLTLLEELLRRPEIRIFILSSRSFESMLAKETDRMIIDRWSNIMNRFYTVYHKWKPENKEKTDKGKEEKPDEEKESLMKDLLDASLKNLTDFLHSQSSNENVWLKKIKKFLHLPDSIKKRNEDYNALEKYVTAQLEKFFKKIDDECRHSDFLWGLRTPLFNYLKEKNAACFPRNFETDNKNRLLKAIKQHYSDLHEQICLKIQSLAANYYLSTWQSLSRDEQRTLYDIALDEMVNPENRDIATRLAGLGLIKPVENVSGYEIMSKSFRNFIFTQLDKKEVNSFKTEGDSKGTWSSLQLPILIVVIAIGIFLFTTQKDSFSSLVTYLGATAGGIGALLKVLGMIPSSK